MYIHEGIIGIIVKVTNVIDIYCTVRKVLERARYIIKTVEKKLTQLKYVHVLYNAWKGEPLSNEIEYDLAWFFRAIHDDQNEVLLLQRRR